jgi:hypothetical protein
MNKIVELLIDFEGTQLDDLGVEIISLVDKPAIEVNWMAFNEHSFVKPTAGESKEDFIGRCIPVVIGEGKDEDQAAAICYNYWDEGLQNFSDFEKHILKVAGETGESIDVESVIYVNASKTEFETLGEYLQGVRALDVLDSLTELAKDQPVRIRYRYAGPSGQRTFCAAMKALNRIYSREDITRMNAFNPGFGAGGSTTYSVFDYKGGVNCRHYWEELAVYNDTNGQQVIVSLGPTEGDAGLSNNENTPSPDGYVPNNASLKFWSFSSDEQMIVTGPAMIPGQLIPRKDEKGNIFHVYFSEETIAKIAEKFLADNNTNNTDINHNSKVVSENTLIQSWFIKDPEMDRSKAEGFTLPKGTWMTSYRINNKETWKKIKAGELNGFSVEGSFLEKLQK